MSNMHSAPASLALINVLPKLGVSLQNIMLFLVFHILQSSAATLSILTAGVTVLALDNLYKILICWLNRKLESI